MTHGVRPARSEDLAIIADFVRELAAYEKLSHAVCFDQAELGRNLFGTHPAAEVLIGEIDGTPQGFALFFPTFSTFEGKPGIWLEDLYVRPDARGRGLGKTLLLDVARLACQRGDARLEWSVLDWNAPAIGLYRKLGAEPLGDWTTMRLSGEALANVQQT